MSKEIIYREAWYGNRPKSVALRRDSDYHTGLSFRVDPPIERSYLIYEVAALEDAGYTIEYDGGQAIVSKWDASWVMRDNEGKTRKYAPHHASVYREHEFWKRWYDAETESGSQGASKYSQDFFVLAFEYVEG